jgi:hypothetical protein
MEPSGAKVLGFPQHRLYQNSQTLNFMPPGRPAVGPLQSTQVQWDIVASAAKRPALSLTTSPILIRNAECFGLPMTMRSWQRAEKEKRLQKKQLSPAL